MSEMTAGPDRPRISAPKAAGGDSPVIPLLLIGIGGWLTWFGVHYFRDTQTKWPSDPVKSVLQGNGLPQPVPAQSVASEIDSAAASGTAGGGATPGSGSVSGPAIVEDALKYQGTPYTWGGHPGVDPKVKGIGPHDCSSFVNWVVGHDLKLAIPNWPRSQVFTGTGVDGHGPDVASWIGWTGVRHVSSKNIQPGDLVAWGPNQHIGIAISKTEMISALDTAQGTVKSAIKGSASGAFFCLRLRETSLIQYNPGSGVYSHAKLVSLWRLAGGSAGKANEAAAIAQAESSGNQGAVSYQPGGNTNVGLWQLETPGGKGAGYSVAQLKNALTNARVAVKASKNGTDWSAWSTYTTGAYRKYLA